MILEHIGLSQINGSLVVLDGVKGVQYDEMAELHLDDGSTRVGRVVEVEGDRCIIQVEDNGPGIAAGEREQVFKPFYRTLGNEADGSGLGLPIVQEIASQHGASVSVEEAPLRNGRRGALFSIRFEGISDLGAAVQS